MIQRFFLNKKDKKAKVPDAGQKKGKKKAEPSDDLEAEFHDDFEASLSQFHPDKTVSDAAPSEPVNASKETPKKKKDPKDHECSRENHEREKEVVQGTQDGAVENLSTEVQSKLGDYQAPHTMSVTVSSEVLEPKQDNAWTWRGGTAGKTPL